MTAPVRETQPSPRSREVRVDEVRDRGAILGLEREWDRLRARVAAEGRPHGPFLSATWFAITAAALAGPERALRVLLARQGGELVGALPLLRERRRIGGLTARVLRSLSDDHSQRFDVLAAHRAAAAALFDHLANDEDWDLLELRDVPEGDLEPRGEVAIASGADWLVAAARLRGCRVARWSSQASPYLPLPSTHEALDAALAPKFRANLRRRARRLVALHGALRLERVVSPSALPSALADAFRLEAAGWKGAARTAIDCDAGLRRRYLAIGRAFFARGQLRLVFLRAGGVRVASHFALLEDGVYSLFKPGWLPALASFGLGHLLVHAVAHALVDEQARELDFLGDALPWKREWTARTRAHAFRLVFRSTLRGHLLSHLKLEVAPALRALGVLRP